MLGAVLCNAPGDAESVASNRRRREERLERFRAERLPPGRYRFICGRRDEPTDNQRRLFDRLVAEQDRIVAPVLQALEADYCLYRDQADRTDPHRLVLYPDADAAEVAWDRVRITFIHLDPAADRIGLELDSLETWHEEHGCGILIEGGRVLGCGGSEELFPIGEEEDADEDDADDGEEPDDGG